MPSYSHILRSFAETPWAILPEKLAEIRAFLEMKASGDEHALRAPVRQEKAVATQVGGTLVMPLHGTITHRANLLNDFSGGTSAEMFSATFREALADPSVKNILIDVNSPGGSASGVDEVASEILAARGTKRVVAAVNGTAASAAYWIASAADEITVNPTGQAGSIGVFAAHQDLSRALDQKGVKMTLVSAGKYKVEGNPFEPLSAEAKAAIQERVDDYYDLFTQSVAKGRGVTNATVRNGFGQGRMLSAARAVNEKMVDRIATFDDTLARLNGRGARRGSGERAFSTIREFEAFLRDEGGCSHQQAKQIAAGGFNKSVATRDEPDRDEIAEAFAQLAKQISGAS